jgi:O-antigen/teichoic acid export membrane protein
LNLSKTLAFSIGPIGGAALTFVSLPIVAWLFSPEDIGRLTMLQATVSFVLLLFSLGLDQAYVREFHEVKDKLGLLKLVFIPGFVILLFVLVGLVFSPWSLSLLLFGIDSLFLTFMLYAAILLSFGSRFLSLILRMQERGLAFSMSQVLPKLLFLFIVLGFVWLEAEAVFDNLIMANFLSLLTVFVIYAWNTRKDWLLALTATIDKTKQSQMIRYAIPLIGGGLAFWGLTTMDKFFLRSMSGFEELGIYSVAVTFAGAALVFQSIFSTIWIPLVYKWVANDEVNSLVIKSVIDYVTFGVVVIWSLTGLCSWLIVYILPQAYLSVPFILLATIAYPLLYTIADASSVGIGIKRKTMYSLLAGISALVVNAAGNWFLIPKFGASGVAMASAIAFFLYFVLVTEASSLLWISFERWRMYSFITVLFVLSLVFNTIALESFKLVVLSYLVVLIASLFVFKKELLKTSIFFMKKLFKK